jgi:hypothetical protein
MNKLLIALLLSSCEFGPAAYISKTCPVPYYGGLLAQFDINCAKPEKIIQSAHDFLVATGEMNDAEFVSLTKNIHLTIRQEAAFGGEDNEAYLGLYDVFNGIMLGSNMEAIVHETFHARDMSRLRLDTFAHSGWYENGQEGIGDMFMIYLVAKNHHTVAGIRGLVSDKVRTNLSRDERFAWLSNVCQTVVTESR